MKKKFAISISVVLLLVLLTVLFVACTPDADKVQKTLEDKGYEVDVREYTEEQTEEYGVTKVLIAYFEDENTEEFVQIAWFSDSDKLKEKYDEMKKEFDEAKAESEEAGEEFNYKFVKKGNALISGTTAAVKLVG